MSCECRGCKNKGSFRVLALGDEISRLCSKHAQEFKKFLKGYQNINYEYRGE